jgi:hypothetical protein
MTLVSHVTEGLAPLGHPQCLLFLLVAFWKSSVPFKGVHACVAIAQVRAGCASGHSDTKPMSGLTF